MHLEMRTEISAIELSVNGAPVSCETQLETAGAYVLAATTVIPDLRCLLASSFLIDVGERAVASHLWEAFGTAGQLRSAQIGLVNNRLARACLIEHLAYLRDRLWEDINANDVRLDVSEEALVEAETAWTVI